MSTSQAQLQVVAAPAPIRRGFRSARAADRLMRRTLAVTGADHPRRWTHTAFTGVVFLILAISTITELGRLGVTP